MRHPMADADNVEIAVSLPEPDTRCEDRELETPDLLVGYR
jgi:hypothetical protein